MSIRPSFPRACGVAALWFALSLVPLRADVIIDTSAFATLGTAGSHTLAGSGTTFTVTPGTNLDSYNPATDDLFVGYNGTGSLTVTNGASVTVPGTGSDPDVGGTQLGFASGSSGTLTVSAGGTFTTRYLQVGLHPESTGTLLVTGSGSSLTLSDYAFWTLTPTSSITITDGATLTSTHAAYTNSIMLGTLTVSAGATLNTASLELNTTYNPAFYTDAGVTDPGAYSATMLVTGTGTTWHNTDTINLTANSAADTVSLTLADHASLTGATSLYLGNHTSFSATSGATVNFSGSVDVLGNATFALASGATAAANAIHLEGGTLSLASGASLTDSSSTWIGYNGIAGTLDVTSGATFTTQSLHVGYGADGYYSNEGSVLLITGAGSTVNVTGSGSGHTDLNDSITITAGGALNTAGLVNFVSDATLSAGGSLASTYAAGSLANTVGGALTVTGTGSLLSLARPLEIYGSLTVTDHATFTLSDRLVVGNYSTGTFTLSGGATAITTVATIGYAGTSSGTLTNATAGHATVTGAGTTWTNHGSLVVGLNRYGDLTISSGAVVNTDSTTIASRGNTGVASITVTGAGSQLNHTGALDVGSPSLAPPTGTLTLADHGLATAASTTVNNGDTLALGSFGTLDTVALTVASGGTVLAHDAAVFSFDLGAPSLTAPLAFTAGSTFTADSGATVYLLLNSTSGFAAGTYALFSFDPAATLTHVAPATFVVATSFADYSYGLDLTATALLLTVTEAPGAEPLTFAGLNAVPEPAVGALLTGLGALGALGARRKKRRPAA